MCNNFYSTRHLINLPKCKDFIEGRSSETFDELVSDLVARSQTRKDEMQKAFEAGKDETQKAFEACGSSEQVLCMGGHRDLVEALEEAPINLLKQAMSFYSKLEMTCVAFGPLKDLFPCPNIYQVLFWKDEPNQNIFSFCKVVVDKNLSMIDSSFRPTGRVLAHNPNTLVNFS